MCINFLGNEQSDRRNCHRLICAARSIGSRVTRGGRVAGRLALGLLRREDEADDETVQTQRLREDQNQHHADVQLRLLGGRAHARVTDDTNRNAGGHPAETAREARRQVRVARERRVLGHPARRGLDLVGDDDSNDEAVDTQHTRHDDWDDRLHHQLRLQHAHRRHAHPRLGSAVGGTEVGKDERDSFVWRHTHAHTLEYISHHIVGLLLSPRLLLTCASPTKHTKHLLHHFLSFFD